MRIWLFLLVFVLLLTGSSEAHCGQSQSSPTSNEPASTIQLSSTVRAACKQIYLAVLGTPGTIIETLEGTFRDEVVHRDITGCMIIISGAWSELAGKQSPVDLIFQFLTDQGWQQQPQYSADGPDGTLYALCKDEVLCLVRGQWDGGDDADTTYVPSDVYQVIVYCVQFGECGRDVTNDD